MSDKVQIGPLISVEARAMLEKMCKDDLRALGNWLDWMIRKEYGERLRQSYAEQPRQMTDASERYEVEEVKG